MSFSEPVQDFSNATLATRIRHWLIQKIAGQHVVILNACFDFCEHQPGAAARVFKVKGGIISSCKFPVRDGKMLSVTKNGAEQ